MLVSEPTRSTAMLPDENPRTTLGATDAVTEAVGEPEGDGTNETEGSNPPAGNASATPRKSVFKGARLSGTNTAVADEGVGPGMYRTM